MKEEIVTINQSSVVGIVSYSSIPANLPAVVLFNAGLIHRVGPNRLYVKIARHLAVKGYTVFRFDYGGRGDSILHNDRSNDLYITDVLNYLGKKFQKSQFIVAGICSGAETSYYAATIDKRVKGVIMINGTGLNRNDYLSLNANALNQIQKRYYKNAIFRPVKWFELIKSNHALLAKKIISFYHVYKRNLKEKNVVTNHIFHPFALFSKLNIDALTIFTEGSIAYDMLMQLDKKNPNDKLSHTYCFLRGVDHNISTLHAQQELLVIISDWLDEKFNEINKEPVVIV